MKPKKSLLPGGGVLPDVIYICRKLIPLNLYETWGFRGSWDGDQAWRYEWQSLGEQEEGVGENENTHEDAEDIRFCKVWWDCVIISKDSSSCVFSNQSWVDPPLLLSSWVLSVVSNRRVQSSRYLWSPSLLLSSFTCALSYQSQNLESLWVMSNKHNDLIWFQDRALIL